MPIAKPTLFSLVCVALLASCSDNEISPHSGMEQLWEQQVGDVKLQKSDAETGFKGGDCKNGTVSDLHVVLCLYKDALSADAARESGLERVGSHTGTALVRENFLLVIDDRDKVDVHGKKLNKIAKLFLEPAKAP